MYYLRNMKINKITGFFVVILISTFVSAQEGIKFTYEFERDSVNLDLVNVKAKIVNKSGADIYFLSESCNGLDYYLTTNSELTEISILNHCNATYPRKIELKANSEHEFKTIIQLNEWVEKFSLNLKLIRLSNSANVEGKFIDEILKENAQLTINLIGPILNIE